MARLGYRNVKNNHIYTTASLVSKYVKREFPEVRKVFAVGMKTIRDSLENEGIEVIGAEQHIVSPDVYFNETMYDNYELDQDIGAVVYGLDTSFTYQKLLLASLYIREKNLPLVVTNDDRGTMTKGKVYPGAGSGLSSILTACSLRKGSSHSSSSKTEPGTFNLIGKPNPFAFNLIMDEHCVPRDSRSVMIGDRPNTDIQFGKAAGIDQCLVLSGVVHSVEDFEQNWLVENPDYDPTYIMNLVGTFKRNTD